MHADFPILLDACVLVNLPLTDLLLRLSEEPRLVVPKWTPTILEEVYRTHKKWPHWTKDGLHERYQHTLKSAFPEAMILNYEVVIPSLSVQEKDRHVLAAAIAGKIEHIVTFNTKDFPDAACARWNVTVKHPQEYLLTLFAISPAIMFKSLDDIAKRKRESREDVLLRLGVHVPEFAQTLLG